MLSTESDVFCWSRAWTNADTEARLRDAEGGGGTGSAAVVVVDDLVSPEKRPGYGSSEPRETPLPANALKLEGAAGLEDCCFDSSRPSVAV